MAGGTLQEGELTEKDWIGLVPDLAFPICLFTYAGLGMRVRHVLLFRLNSNLLVGVRFLVRKHDPHEAEHSGAYMSQRLV